MYGSHHFCARAICGFGFDRFVGLEFASVKGSSELLSSTCNGLFGETQQRLITPSMKKYLRTFFLLSTYLKTPLPFPCILLLHLI